MKAKIVAKIDFEKLDNLIETYKSQNSSEDFNDMFLIMNNETGCDFTNEGIARALGCKPNCYKGIKIAYCDAIEYGVVHIK